MNEWEKVNESDEGCSLEFGVQYLEILHEIHNDLPFLADNVTKLNMSFT